MACLPAARMVGNLDNRITSYNVCYTKLLRASNPERMAGFYSNAFGLEFRRGRDDEYIMAEGKVEGGRQMSGRVRHVQPLRVTGTPTMHVLSVDDAVRRIMGAGGRLLVPKKVIPRVGYMRNNFV